MVNDYGGLSRAEGLLRMQNFLLESWAKLVALCLDLMVQTNLIWPQEAFPSSVALVPHRHPVFPKKKQKQSMSLKMDHLLNSNMWDAGASNQVA